MYLSFLLTFLVIQLGIDFYFYKRYATLTKGKNYAQWIHRIYWSFTVFSVAVLGIALYHYISQTPPPKFARTYLFGFVFIVLISKVTGLLFFLIDDLKNLIVFLIRKLRPASEEIKKGENTISRNQFLKKTGVVAALLPFTALNYGMLFSAFNFKVRKTTVKLDHLPEALNGLKIVQISDIHTGSFISRTPFEEAVALINAQNPDLVLFTGDLVNEIAEEAEPFIDVFKAIKAPLGVYSVLGNHDYGDYFYPPGDAKGRIHNRQLMQVINERMGWNLLLNEHRILEFNGAKIGLIGSENWGHAARFPKYGDLDKATAGMDSCDLKLLLSHDPSHWEAQVVEKHPEIDITFSGHTHGFQMGIEIPGFKWSPAKYLYKQWAGLYKKGQQYIYVNRGLGFLGYPGRLGILPEITVMEIHQSGSSTA